MRRALFILVLALVSGTASRALAAKITDVSVLDRDILVVHVLDGEVTHENPGETVTRYTPELSTSAAAATASWTLRSSQDANFSGAGKHPSSCSRKTKLSGHAQMEWVTSDYRYEYTYQHWIYLRLPNSLQQGMTYTLDIAAATNGDQSSASFTFDVFNSRSEAVHVNLVGYAPDAPHKAADLYHWLGSGGARDYSGFVGSTVYVYNVASRQSVPVGQVAFWKASGGDLFGYNLTRSSVWNADFSAFTTPGTYRLVVDGVGCSQDFTIAPDVYADPFQVSVRGFFYMRLGQDNAAGLVPPPRTPLYIPGVSPANTKAYLTTMQPWNAQWGTFSGGDVWDNPDAWAPFRKAGNPTNPNAWGGHADAADRDRHLGHVSIIYDMLLPFILTDGAIDDDDAGIAESGNGIPDLLDEARYEVDFWLRLRDGAGYSHGLTNPNGNNEFFQAGPTAIAAWANAANCAMLAEAFRIAGNTSLRDQYRASAVTAYTYANGLSDPMLDATQNIGDGSIRSRDLKMMAAAFLYNVTGDQTYEAAVNAESVCATAVAELDDGNRNQVWATAGYLLTPQTVHFATLRNNMKAAVIAQAKSRETNYIDGRPSRRATDERTGYFRTEQNVDRTLIAHAVTTDLTEKALFRKALALEADWGLGRNPLNMIEMTTAFTPLASKRSCEHIYTSGRDDGVPGMDPGHTPYLNLDDWAAGMTMGMPSRLYENGYPADFKNTWPIAEGYFDTPWVWAHSEYTPQQTMRGKMALYGYLYGLGAGSTGPTCTDGLKNGNETAVDCGGGTCPTCADGATCAVAADCRSGICQGGTCGCPAGQTACSGSCVTTATDNANCGACGNACSAPLTCQSGSCNCTGGLTHCGASCVNVATDNANCGGCGTTCGAGRSCQAGSCQCTGGFTSCGAGCVNVATDNANCGGCGTACAADRQCQAGSCQCTGGLTSCGASCVNVATDNANCGGCGTACAADRQCQGASCACRAGLAECTGVCVNQTSDPANCGGCGNACGPTQVCSGSTCTSSCAAGLVECASACVDEATDNANCGGCGTACDSTRSCQGGSCECTGGLVDCGGTCADTGVDGVNCGACGTACAAGQSCVGGSCSCDGGLTLCDGGCADTDSDDAHCGACGNACGAGRTCVSGQCECAATLLDCGGACVTTSTDPANCGGCGLACGTNLVCAAGSCACTGGLALCQGRCVDTQSSGANCGACGSACPAGQVCNAGVCGSGCALGLVQCGQDCVDPTSSLAHCGACDVACALPGAVAACVASQCAVGSCQPGFFDVNGSATDGCEYACTPTGAESCNGLDDDCNGVVDDGCGGTGGTGGLAGSGGTPATGGAPAAGGSIPAPTGGAAAEPADSSGDKSGCGCVAAGSGRASALGWLAAAALAVIARRRRLAPARSRFG